MHTILQINASLFGESGQSSAEGLALGDQQREQALAAATARIGQLAA